MKTSKFQNSQEAGNDAVLTIASMQHDFYECL
jgi:hypothetical protein